MYDDGDDRQPEVGSDEWYEDCYDKCIAGDDAEYWNREIEKAADKWEP